MALQSITLTTGARVVGRALARNGAVTLDTNTIIRPTPCAAASTGTRGSQVTQVPSGAVSSGDGSTSRDGNNGLALLAGVLVFVGLAAAAALAARRRRLHS